MTITVNDARNEYTATASQTVFSYTFRIFADTDLNVYITPAGQDANDLNDITTSYTVSGVDDEAGGAITLSSGVNAGDLVTIVSDIPSSRTTDYQANGDFTPETVNRDVDRVVALTKQVEDVSNRSLVSQQAQQGQKPLTLPAPVSSSLMRWKSDLTGFENVALADLDSNLILDQDLIKVFGSVAAMAVDTGLIIGKKVITLGYYSEGDGGGNTYEIIAAATGTDDGGSYIDLDSLQAQGLFPHRIGVKQFGAKGDESQDDTAEIQNAIDYISGLGGGELWFPLGAYKVSDTIDVASNGVTLVGNGVTGTSNSTLGITHMRDQAVSRIVWDATAGTAIPVVLFKPPITEIVGTAGGIRNLVVDGNNRADTCIELQSWFHGDFQNLVTLDGVWAGLSLTCRDVTGDTLGPWDGTGPWLQGDIVTGSDGRYWFALQDGGEAEDPVLDTNKTYWSKAAEGSVFNTFRMYQHWSPTSNGMGVVFWRKNIGSIGPNNNFFYQANIKVKGGIIEAVSFQESDHNAVYGLHSNGAGVVFHADDTGSTIADKSSDRTYSRGNAVYFCNTGSGTAKATIAGSTHSEGNLIEVAPGDGGAIRNWTIEDGATLNIKHSFSVSGANEWGGYEIGKSPSTARAKLSTNQSILEDTDTPIAWAAMDYEITNIWALANPTYFTVPQGVFAVKMTGSVLWATSASGNFRRVWLEKNNGTTDEESGTNTTLDATGVTLTETGSDFTAAGVTVGDRVLNVTDGSSASITVVGTTTVTTDGLSGGSDNEFQASDAFRIIKFSTFNGMADQAIPAIAGTGSTNAVDFVTGWIECSPGDKFIVMCRQDLAGVGALNILTSPRTWLHFECR